MEVTRDNIYTNDANFFLDDCKESGIESDMIFTDPPYGVSNKKNKTITRPYWTDIEMHYGEWDVFDDKKELLAFTFNWIDKAHLILKDGGFFASFFDSDHINFISAYLKSKYKYKVKNLIAWCKTDPTPQYHGKKLQNGWEMIGIWQKPSSFDDKGKPFYEDLFRKDHHQHPDWIHTAIISGKERASATIYPDRYKYKVSKSLRRISVNPSEKGLKNINENIWNGKKEKKPIRHPNQKPMKVCELVIRYFSKMDDLIVDPFCGSGSIPLSCKDNYRDFIANDIDKLWTYIAKYRMKVFTSTRKLYSFI